MGRRAGAVRVLANALLVLLAYEVVSMAARRAPHARVLTFIVALAPMVWRELLLKSPGSFPSREGALLGLTAMLFAVLARLPARFPPSRASPP